MYHDHDQSQDIKYLLSRSMLVLDIPLEDTRAFLLQIMHLASFTTQIRLQDIKYFLPLIPGSIRALDQANDVSGRLHYNIHLFPLLFFGGLPSKVQGGCQALPQSTTTLTHPWGPLWQPVPCYTLTNHSTSSIYSIPHSHHHWTSTLAKCTMLCMYSFFCVCICMCVCVCVHVCVYVCVYFFKLLFPPP